MRIVPYFAIVLLAFLPIGKDVLSPINNPFTICLMANPDKSRKIKTEI